MTLADPDQSCPAGTSAPAASGCTRFAYNANGAEILRTFQGNATVATTRDNSGRATRITAKDGSGATKVDIGYSFTAPGGSGASGDRTNIQTRTSYLEQGITAGAVTTYSYDSLNRLKLADEKVGSTANASWAYSYDNAGNRTKQIRTGNTEAAAGTIDTTYNAANQITGATGSNGSWTYDAAGNQTRNALTGVTSTFNDRGAVTAIGSSTYTAWKQGNTNTLTRTNGGTTNGYLVSPTGLVMSGSTGASQRRAYTRTPDGELTTVRYFEERYSFVKDSLGSVVGAFNRNGAWQGGYSYSPYGETRSTFNGVFTNDNPIRYISGYYDATIGLYRLGARYYDPSLGRFTQVDPSGQEANGYSYGTCNPVNNSDPTGLAVLDKETCFNATTFNLSVALFGLSVAGVGGLVALSGVGAPVAAIIEAAAFGIEIGAAANALVIHLLCDDSE